MQAPPPQYARGMRVSGALGVRSGLRVIGTDQRKNRHDDRERIQPIEKARKAQVCVGGHGLSAADDFINMPLLSITAPSSFYRL